MNEPKDSIHSICYLLSVNKISVVNTMDGLANAVELLTNQAFYMDLT